MDSQQQISPYAYNGGRPVLERVQEILKENNYGSLSTALDISRSTLSTWRNRDLTPFELASRMHIKLGVSLTWLLLGEGEKYDNEIAEANQRNKLPSFELNDGELAEKAPLYFDPEFLGEKATTCDLMVVTFNDQKLFVDKNTTKIVSGSYLTKSKNDFASIVELERSPLGEVMLGDNVIDESQLDVLGKVVLI
ncbi:helix-turn-helix domain-containing protein [Aliivibrio sp. S4TY2]|uniref:helix-turn-helix domain-containing protein n=1 Tax=unclassified Aliivibrio TaxID=2645654 RepID=UPI0023781E4F|nr:MULTISPECIES: helix-turn-helix domain-containing protein [unclassified Aliivibrio]MDD9155435.1 helix-turn-helix domain-containing protein [Aliivibrio sp. S4TY2]MDD9161562.1 helix-turn-helix domain-containing protein [Aliivibrio sp. S4TY1]MDD9165592.1 helix-turn-helix domain-containing protein [Aliivibrio sp. S4MY2]MDD9169591.1 helix-turn-helix domain-containing protein [Aliivibrio sp. S4MY4]MDD9186584.1 helix-turn-helix domain-containing protein [Aliivibrio sp. S4MY3]